MAYQLPDYTKMVNNPVSFAQPEAISGFAPVQDLTGFSAATPSPTLGGAKGWFAESGLGNNMSTYKAAGQGIQTLAGLWSAIQSAKMAKKQYDFTRATTNANLANQTQSYNTGISDRARARGAMEGQTSDQVADYIAKNSLAKRTV